MIAKPGQPKWPGRVMEDRTLAPVDKIVWMVLRQSAVQGQFPGYAQIGQAANVASKSTVARAIAILKLTRWLARYVRTATGSATHDGLRGKIHGENAQANQRIERVAATEAYVLADAPLPVSDVLYLDRGYIRFLRFAQVHSHARVRKVAQDELASLDEDDEQ